MRAPQFFLSFLICLLAVASQQMLYAQSSNLFFDHFTTVDGLSATSTTAIAQDVNSYLWIGTSQGLNRFDGVRFEKFYHNLEDSLSLPGNVISDILIDPLQRMWIGTFGDGVALRNVSIGKFKRYRLPSAGYSERSSNKTEGLYWFDHTLIVSCASGAFYFDETQDKFRLLNDGFLTNDDVDFGLQIILTPDTINRGLWLRNYADYYFITEGKHEMWGASNNPNNWVVFDDFIRSTPTVDTQGKLWYQDWDDEKFKSFSPAKNIID
ncbi:MAG: two-component regulator propeller domain-containing protein [Flavobacteriales bacterium]|nr:two-component regulator propeller domain-containing protein [Flavobacteriales bacterium]